MLDRTVVAESIRDHMLTRWPHRFAPHDLDDDVSLGEDGLGLDSVEIVEVLLACEERCGRTVTEDLFLALPLTIERVARHFADEEGVA